MQVPGLNSEILIHQACSGDRQESAFLPVPQLVLMYMVTVKNEFGQTGDIGQSNLCRGYVLTQSPEEKFKVRVWRNRY